jgi:stage III sporulation protein AD
MSIWSVCAVAILCGVCALAVREAGIRSFSFVTVLCTVLFTSFIVLRYAEPITYLKSLADTAGISEHLALVLKVLFVGYCVGFSSDLCRDMGEARIGALLEGVGRAEILLLCIPAIKDMIELALKMVTV